VLDDAGAVRAFEVLQELWAGGVLARESLFARYDTEVDHLADGTSWLAQNWSFTSAQLARQGRLPRFMVYAGWEGPSGAGHVVGGDVLGIPRGVTGEQREAALELARFLMSEESQEHLARTNAWPSITVTSGSGVPEDQKETFAAIREALEQGWAGRSVSHWCHVRDAMNDAVDRILTRHEAARPVLDELHARVERARREGVACRRRG
jgi:trehalose transport system substrate-binding protein